jgi:hypothetical protein
MKPTEYFETSGETKEGFARRTGIAIATVHLHCAENFSGNVHVYTAAAWNIATRGMVSFEDFLDKATRAKLVNRRAEELEDQIWSDRE